MDAYPEYEGHSDVVFTVHWRLDGVDGEHTAGVYGTAGLALDPEATYVAYADLTEAQVRERMQAYEDLCPELTEHLRSRINAGLEIAIALNLTPAALTLGMMLTAKHVQMSWYFLLFAGVYTLVRLFQLREGAGRPWLGAGLRALAWVALGL
jgi:hypothetical protein